MRVERLLAISAGFILLLTACGPAATATPQAPRATPKPTATATPAGEQPKAGGILRVAVNRDRLAWDPAKDQTDGIHVPGGLIHERFYRFRSGPPACELRPMEPALALGWKWVDDQTLDVNLRKGVKLQDAPPVNGREFDADDAVATLTKLWPRAPWSADIMAEMKEITAADKYTLRIRLKRVVSPLPEMMFSQRTGLVIPKESLAQGEITGPEQHVGAGPFKLSNYAAGSKWELRRNPTYWNQPLPYLDGIDLYVMPDLSARLAAVRGNKVDLLRVDDVPTGLEMQRTNPELKVQRCPYSAGASLAMRVDQPPLNDVAVRRAISMAIDRATLLRTVYEGQGELFYGIIPPLFPEYSMVKLADYPPEVRQWMEYNPEKARQVLAKAGYTDAVRFPLIFTNIFRDQAVIAESMADMLSKAGLKPELKQVDWPSMQGTVYAGKYDGAAVMYINANEDVQTVARTNLHSTEAGRNFGHVKDAKIDALLDEMRVTRDENRTKQLMRELQTYYVDQVLYIHFPLNFHYAFAQPRVQGLYFRAMSRNLDSDWLYNLWLKD